MEFRLRHASELLAALIAYHRSSDFAFLERGGLDRGVCLICVVCTGDFIEGLVLVVLEPLESSLYCGFVSALDI
jgi:hypothetical protein